MPVSKLSTKPKRNARAADAAHKKTPAHKPAKKSTKRTAAPHADGIDARKPSARDAATLLGAESTGAAFPSPIIEEIDGFTYTVLGPEGRKFLDGLLEGHILRADPAPLDKHKDADKKDFSDQPTTIDGAGADDVLQGKIANCFRNAGASGIANALPGYIDNFTVEEIPAAAGEKKHWRVYFSDGDVQEVGGNLYVDDNGKPLYGRTRPDAEGQMEMWWPVLEKASVQRHANGYNGDGGGGSAAQAMSQLLGQPDSSGRARPARMQTASTSGNIAQEIRRAVDASLPMVAATFGKDQEARYKDTNISPWHAYTVLGYAQKDGEFYVVLRNPWGKVEPANNGPDDGIFRLPLKTFQYLYAQTYAPTGPVLSADQMRQAFGRA